MRVPYKPPAQSIKIHYLQRGGVLPGVQYSSGFFANLLKAAKTVALPALKAVARAALPMAKQAIMAGLVSDGSVNDRLRAAGQTAITEKNLVGLAKAGRKAAMARPF